MSSLSIATDSDRLPSERIDSPHMQPQPEGMIDVVSIYADGKERFNQVGTERGFAPLAECSRVLVTFESGDVFTVVAKSKGRLMLVRPGGLPRRLLVERTHVDSDPSPALHVGDRITAPARDSELEMRFGLVLCLTVQEAALGLSSY